jgi:hypothetical protein
MSYDLDLESEPYDGECFHCGSTYKKIDTHYRWNYTSNCAPMWRLAGADLKEFHGKRASECVEVLARAVADMEADPEKYKALDPPNQWGAYVTLLPALQRMLEAMRDYPDSIVSVCY